MNANDRARRIIQILTEKRFASVSELESLLKVSDMTVRRDLHALEQQGKLKRRFGGASLETSGICPEADFFARAQVAVAAKKAIAARAVSHLQDGDVVFLDAGTTTLPVAHLLCQKGLVVATYSLPTANVLAARSDIQWFCTGGQFSFDNQCFSGPEAVQFIRQMNATVAVMATTGLSIEKGLTNRYKPEAELKRAMIESAARVLLVMESAKMGRNALCTVCPLKKIDLLITDSGLSPENRRQIEKQGVRVETITVSSKE
jgi:DeoR/GlpR family transcriptional regulator of sugar metabolism